MNAFMGYSELASQIAKPALRDYVVALQPLPEQGSPGWWRELSHNSLEEARIAYDLGHVEMAQARHKDHLGREWMLQYAIPRQRQRQTHLNYFVTQRVS